MFTYVTIFAIVHFCDIICAFHCMHRILNPRPQMKHAFLYAIPFLLFSPCYEIITGDVRSPIRYLAFLISYTLPIFIFYKDSILHKISAWLFAFLLSLLTELTFANTLWTILQHIFHYPYSSLQLVPQNEIGALCAYIVPVTIIQSIIIFNGYKIWNYMHMIFNLKIIFEIMLSPVLFASEFVGALDLSSPIIDLFFFTLFFLTNLLFLKGVKDLAANMKKARNNQLMKKNLELLLSDYEAMEQQNLSIRLKNHDIANHLRTVEYLISENQVDEAKDYLEKNLNLKSFYHTL